MNFRQFVQLISLTVVPGLSGGCSKPKARVFNNPVDPIVVAERAAAENENSNGGSGGEGSGLSSIEVVDSRSYDCALANTEDGANTLVSVRYDRTSSRFLIVKDQVRRFSDNLEYRPMLLLNWSSGEFPASANYSQINFSDWMPANIVGFQGNYYTTGNFSENPTQYSEWFLVSYDLTGEVINQSRITLDAQSTGNDHVDIQSYLYKTKADDLRIIATRRSQDLVQSNCLLNLASANFIVSCENAPATNPSIAAPAKNASKGIGVLNDSVYLMARDSSGNYEVQKFDPDYKYIKSYKLNNLQISKTELDSGVLSDDDQDLYFVSLKDDLITFRKLSLVE